MITFIILPNLENITTRRPNIVPKWCGAETKTIRRKKRQQSCREEDLHGGPWNEALRQVPQAIDSQVSTKRHCFSTWLCYLPHFTTQWIAVKRMCDRFYHILFLCGVWAHDIVFYLDGLSKTGRRNSIRLVLLSNKRAEKFGHYPFSIGIFDLSSLFSYCVD